jgi:methylmalonyl-CoA/ethylmalonyl-CoA epimerase
VNPNVDKAAGTTAGRGGAGGPARGLSLRPHHVGISVADLEASIAWYEEFLGFALEAVVPVPEDVGRVAMLVNDGGFRVELFELPQAAPLPDERRHPATDLRTHGVKHLAYAVTGIEAFAERLRAAGADIVWDLRVHEDVKVLFLRDNTGNLVEVVEPLGSGPPPAERTPAS